MHNQPAKFRCACGKCPKCRQREIKQRYYIKHRDRLIAAKVDANAKAKARRAPTRYQRNVEDPVIDPWELENWCNDAAAKRKTETYSRGKSTLPGAE